VELLIQDKKKVIVNVDRIKPYQIPEVPKVPERIIEKFSQTLPTSTAGYEFDGEKFEPIPRYHNNNGQKETKVQDDEVKEAPVILRKTKPNQIVTETRKRGRPRKSNPEQLKTSPKKNKWNMEDPLPSTSRMITRSRASEIPKDSMLALHTSIPCFCGNQKLLKFHSKNCKQQMLNWASTGDPYSYTEADWAHESEISAPLYENDEDEFGLHHLFNETGYRGSSDIDPEERQEEPPAEEEEDQLPDLGELENLDLNETPPPGTPRYQSTPESGGARPKARPQESAQNKFPGTDEYYSPFGPHDLYQARIQNLHRNYHERCQNATKETERRALRQQLYQQLQDAEESFQLLTHNPNMMNMTPEQLKVALSKPATAPKPEKKKLILPRILRTPDASPDGPHYFTRFQLKKRKEKEEQLNPK
jgi:hypothetical protein